MNKKTLIYLGCPYSDPDPLIREQRFNAVNAYAARLMNDGKYVFSPISHGHPIALAGDLPNDFAFWEGLCREMMSHCGELRILMLPGWQESVGVLAELLIADELGIPISYISEK